jgi:DNA mismatch repair protein MSH4
MSGKSTYLRQLVLLQILAQLGCFVPAASATFRPADAIFSRLSTGDSIECNASTFTMEMNETAYILGGLGETSLVVVDELGRGTSAEEGAAICWAVAEALIGTKAFCFLATHFSHITRLEELYCTAAK